MKEARSRLCQLQSDSFHISLTNAMKDWRIANRSRQDTRIKHTEQLAAAAAPSSFTPAFLLPLQGDVIPLPAQHADRIWAWRPEVRPEVEAKLPGVMYSDREKEAVAWDNRHVLTCDSDAAKIKKKATVSAFCGCVGRQARACVHSGRCHL